MFKKLLSKLGIGSAKINLVLHHPHVRVGEKIEGEFFIEGGMTEQHIRKLDVELRLIVHANGQQHRQTVAVIPVAPSFTIQPGERKVWPFSYTLPLHLPITRYGVEYVFVTRLDIADGVDAFDQDAIRILPPVPLEKIFYALDKLGFREKPTSGKITAHGQEFAFFPTESFRGVIEEIECFAFFEEHGIRLQLEVDVLNGILGFGERELKRDVFFSYDEVNDVEGLAQKWHMLLQEMVQQPQMYAHSSYISHQPHVPHDPGYYHTYPSRHHGHGMMGAIGGFAAGMLAGMVAEELIEDVVEDAFDVGDQVEDMVGDWFDGDDDIDIL
ncbi:sporulation protein [Anoxybacillus sp. J5B_2022]|uniref:sporulation protein n=1 Tax=Anoxybacillus sp. J5B_2022 TaxID=3003246 RepID=UPI0022861E51|nr:sporulation protein [Anoxybacillus sp. J5B_2022]MCZ0755842.1 sporulation protein [Anoxybacillus sp. J5B_2022]